MKNFMLQLQEFPTELKTAAESRCVSGRGGKRWGEEVVIQGKGDPLLLPTSSFVADHPSTTEVQPSAS